MIVYTLIKMLSTSCRISPANIPMPLVQLQHHMYFTTKADRRVKIIRTRAEQKQLFGEVIRNETQIINNQQNTGQNSNAANSAVKDVKALNRNQSSEFHWLVKNGQSSRSFIEIKNFQGKSSSKDASFDSSKATKQRVSFEQNHSTSRKTKNESNTWSVPDPVSDSMQTNQSSTTTNAKGAIISAKNLLKSFVIRKSSNDQQIRRSAAQEIPFDMDELNAIVKYPLVTTEKCSLSQTISLTSMQIPSISKVLTATMPEGTRIALKKWKMAKIAELGADGFKQYEKETFGLGKDFHSAIEQFLNNGETPAPDSSINQLWQSINQSLNELQPKAVLLEQPILHADLKYKGIIDNVSMVKNELCAFEWKTSEKAKPRLSSTYDAPVQLCAYLGALNADPRYDLVVKNGRVVIAYKNGDVANVFELTETDLRKYWMIWLQRLQEYWIRVKDGTLPDPI